MILGFLDVTAVRGAWDPTLGVALTAAVVAYAPAFRWLRRRGTPFMRPRFDLPTNPRIDGRLVTGALLFGLGWGIAGMCPGANVVAMGTGDPRAWLFAVSWMASLILSRQLEDRFRSSVSPLRSERMEP